MTSLRAVAFAEHKAGNAPEEWEDGAAGHFGDPSTGSAPRFVISDGATAAYDSLKWVRILVASFISESERPALAPAAMRAWFELLQEHWKAIAPTSFANPWSERKFRAEGSYATLLGCELVRRSSGLSWNAVALGDSILFHVRGDELVTHFPPIRPSEFGLAPDLAYTLPVRLSQMTRDLRFAAGQLIPGDMLFMATDALAHWMLSRSNGDDRKLWRLLGDLDNWFVFRRLVSDLRNSAELENDDVTLLRINIDMTTAAELVVFP